MSLTIQHTYDGGTLLLGTSRGDGVSDLLRNRPGGIYWKWSSNIGEGGAWYVPRTREQANPPAGIPAVADALRAAGFSVTVSTDGETTEQAPTAAPVPARKASPFAPGVPTELSTREYVDTATIAKWIRAQVKAMRAAGEANGGVDLPADAKVTVRTDKYAGGSSIDVAIWAPAEWVYAAPGAPEGPEYHHQPAHGGYTLAAQVAQSIIKAMVDRYNWDNSDSMTDYFDVRFYGSVELRVAGTDFGRPRVDPSLSPVAIGSTVDRFDARDAFRRTPYAIARAEEQAHAENERRTAEAQEAEEEISGAVEAFAAQLDTVDTVTAVVEDEARAAVVAAHEAEQAETVAEIEQAADAFGAVALAEETITRQPDSYRLAGYDGRGIHATWVLTWHDDDHTQPHEITELWVSHRKGEGFTASLHRGTVGAPSGTGCTGTTYSDMMWGLQVGAVIPAARYSRKGLVAATKTKVAEVMADRGQYLPKFLVSGQGAGSR